MVREKMLPIVVYFVNLNKETNIGLPTISKIHRLPEYIADELNSISEAVFQNTDSALALSELSEYHG